MPYRLCLFGDSHLAALKNFWIAGDHDGLGLAPTFVPGVRDNLTRMEARDGRLFPIGEELEFQLKSWSGVDSIDPEAYDGFALIGLGLRYQSSLHGILRYGIHGEAGAPTLISKPAFSAMMRDRLAGAAAIEVARLLRQVTDKKILAVAQPLPAERFAEHENRGALDRAGVELAARLTGPVMQEWFDGLDVDFVFQDPATYAENGLTQDRYSMASRRFSGETLDAEDVSHMNPGYGAVVLRQIADRLATRAPHG